jgi:hypothetical protein
MRARSLTGPALAPGNPLADRPVAGTTRACMRGAGSDATGTMGELRLDEGKTRVPGSLGYQCGGLAADIGGCDPISLRQRPMRGKIALSSPGIRGMSGNMPVYVCTHLRKQIARFGRFA